MNDTNEPLGVQSETLRRAAAINTCRSVLAEVLRVGADPMVVEAAAARALGECLRASRVVYAETDGENADACLVTQQYCAPAVVPLPDRLSAEVLGTALREVIAADRTIVVDDVLDAVSPGNGDNRPQAITSSRSYVAVPLITEGRPNGFLSVHDSMSRAWTAEEIAFVEEAADRTWMAVGRARATESLRDTDARLQQALDAAHMGTFVWHVQEDRGEPDVHMLELIGLPHPGVMTLEAAIKSLVHPDDRQRYSDAVGIASDPAGAGTLHEDIRVLRHDGTMRWLEITARMTFEGNPRHAVKLVGTAADITERRRIEDALRQSEDQLREIDRRKDEFLAVLAHELRNPLAPVRTGLELIRLSGDSPAAIARVRAMMERQVNHMVRLIDDLLDVSRITSGKVRLQRVPTPLVVLLNTALDANRSAFIDAGIELQVDLPDAPVWLDVDPTRFVQVVSNVLHNAAKFTETPGLVCVLASLHRSDTADRDDVVLTITDSGVGISGDMLPRVFDLFAQDATVAHRAHNGLGVGLALARSMLEMHGGSIEAHSDGPRTGSVFTIRMPAMLDVPGVPRRPQPPSRVEITRRVVVIDDNVDAADATAMLVEAMGGDAWVAYDGESGIERVLEFEPDVVLLDIGLPGIDGYEVCRRLRDELGSNLAIVALTGWGQEEDKKHAIRAGFTAHLTKPVDPAALEQLLIDTTSPTA